MRIAHARREEMHESSGAHGGAGTFLFKGLWDNTDLQTPWFFIHSAILMPGSGIGHHRHDQCEEIFVTVDNAAQFTHNGRTAEVMGGAAVPLRLGESHAIYNHTDRETRWFNFNVVAPGCHPDQTDFGDDRSSAPLESVDRLPVGRFDRTLLHYGQTHSGKGEVGVREVWGHQDFRTSFGFLKHCLLPAHTSIGYHKHDLLEECYVIINGSGRMTVDDETVEVGSGDAVLNDVGSSRGLYNHTQDDLELFVVAVCLEKGKFDSIDLNDDLSGR